LLAARRPYPHLLRGEYRIRRVTKVEGNTLEELAHKLDGVDADAVLRTVREFNAACRNEVTFNPNVLDGLKTEGLPINKTNCANPIDTPPFHAYHVTTGITFTFGGLKISTKGEVEDLYGRVSMRPAKWSAGCSSTITPAERGSCRERSSAGSRDAARRKFVLARVSRNAAAV